MSSYLTEAGPVNLAENASVITPGEACGGSDTLLELTPLRTNTKALIGTV